MYSWDNTSEGAVNPLVGLTIVAAIIISVLLIVPMFYVTKKGYSRKWEDE
ncbi:hypothetical protein RE628_09185 [Paenibacillus sp. D2_2]|nr:hypothetical protein [Paenibacillus sp. D2_2]WMT42494.1 hypothetical protein RE628_09185 [Paenibacillus sp. D2_2]